MSRKPFTTADSAPLWDGYEEGVLRLPYGKTTGKAFLPPSPVSPYDLDEEIEWREASGRGRIATYVVVRRQYFKALPPPYVVVPVTSTRDQGSPRTHAWTTSRGLEPHGDREADAKSRRLM